MNATRSTPAAENPFVQLEERLLAAGQPTPGRDPVELRRTLRYHLDEYRQRRDARNHGLLGRAGLVRGRVLDVGCGLGQLLLTAGQTAPVDVLVGVDRDGDVLRCGVRLSRSEIAPAVRPVLLAGDALHLPFADGVFDLVTCCVVLMSLPVSPALQELGRVVRPGGHLYLHLTGWRFYAYDLLRGSVAGSLFALANGVLLHLTGRQIRLRGLWNNFQTPRQIVRLLCSAGFSIEVVARGPRSHGGRTNYKILARRSPRPRP